MNRREFIVSLSGAGVALGAAAHAAQSVKLRVAVIGHTGRGNFGHDLDRPWNRLDDTEIVAVADADPAGLTKALGRMKRARGFADYHLMLRQVKPDITVICPRHVDQHHAMALAAIEAGPRAIYLEKPMCRNLDEADEIIAACRQRSITCAVAHRNRYSPTIPVLTKLIEAGGIGRLIEVRGRGKEDARGGANDLWVLGSHVLNAAVCFTGVPRAVTAVLLKGGRPVERNDLVDGTDAVGLVGGDELHARFETERNVPLFFDSVKNVGTRESGFGFQLIGTEGVVDLRLDQHPIAHLVRGSPFVPTSSPRSWIPITSGGVGVPEPLANEVELVRDHLLAARDLVDAMRQKRAPLCSVEDGRLNLAMIMGIFESHCRGGSRVTFPLATKVNPLTRL